MGKAAQRTSQIQVDARPLAQPSPQPETVEPLNAPALGVGWGWGVALFLWATAFAFMVIYELLSAGLKAAARLF
jgi:hypothetical protein